MAQNNKDKKKHFHLPSALQQLQHHIQNETQQFIHELNQEQDNNPLRKSKKEGRHSSLFKLNVQSSAMVSQVPVQIIKKRSKSQKLQSLQSEQQEAFSLLDHYKQTQTKQIKQKSSILKKIDIDLRQIAASQGKVVLQPDMEQEDEKYQIVKPSEPYNIQHKIVQSIFQPTVFQTPILPCFSSQFKQKGEGNKRVRQGEGLWKIGKIKVIGQKCELRVGQFLFEGDRVTLEGKSGAVIGSQLHMVPQWRNIWQLQPHSSLFH